MRSIFPTEQQECELFHQWLTLKGLPHTHIGNEGIARGGADFARTRKMKAMGQSKGFPDYLVIVKDRVVAIEMKRRKGGKVSPEQQFWLDTLNSAGIESVVCYGFEEAKKLIEERL